MKLDNITGFFSKEAGSEPTVDDSFISRNHVDICARVQVPLMDKAVIGSAYPFNDGAVVNKGTDVAVVKNTEDETLKQVGDNLLGEAHNTKLARIDLQSAVDNKVMITPPEIPIIRKMEIYADRFFRHFGM